MTAIEFDFRKPPAGTLEKKIASWLTEACSLARNKWSNYLAFPAEIELLKCEAITTGTAVQRMPEGAIAFALTVDGYAKDAFLMGMSRPALLSLIGGTFGEVYNALPPDRDLTAVEDSVANFLVQELILNLLQAAWPIADPLKLSVSARGAPKAVCNLPFAELIVLATISYSGPFGSQPVFLLLPRSGIVEMLVNATQEQLRIETVDREHIESLVREMSVDLSVVLGSAQITMQQLASLKAGDVVILGQKITDPLRAKISGADKFQVWPGTVGRKQAIQIESPVGK